MIQSYRIVSVAKPRMTKRDKWLKRPCTTKYWAFADEVRARGVEVGNGDSITFGIPMPDSWSKKKKEKKRLTPHEQKPDIDNLLKALLDALFEDDSHIHDIKIKKVWATRGFIIIENGD